MFTKKFMAILLGFLFLSVSCAHIGVRPRSPEALRVRVNKLWQAKAAGDWAKVYEMTTSNYRAKVKKSSFLSSPKIRVVSFALQEIKVLDPGKGAEVRVKAKLDFMGRLFPMLIREKWKWEDGQWRLNLDPTSFKSLFMHKRPKKTK